MLWDISSVDVLPLHSHIPWQQRSDILAISLELSNNKWEN